jgi:hypothetical protein
MRKLSKKNIISLLEALELPVNVKATRDQLEDKLVEFLEKHEEQAYPLDRLNEILDESEPKPVDYQINNASVSEAVFTNALRKFLYPSIFDEED